MPGGMGADAECLCNGDIGAPLRQQQGHLGLPGREAELHLQVGGSRWCEPIPPGRSSGSLLPYLLPQVAHLQQRAVNAIDQRPSVFSQRGKGGQDVAESLLGSVVGRVGRLFLACFLSVHLRSCATRL